MLGRQAEPALQDIAAFVLHEDASVRALALNLLVMMACFTSDVVPILIQALEDARETNRCLAVVALGALGSAAVPAIPSLLKALGDEDNDVCSKAREALDKVGRPNATIVPDLI